MARLPAATQLPARVAARPSSAMPHGTPPARALELRVPLATRTKLLCACAASIADVPNANTCPICLALPGARPAINAHAVEQTVRAATVLGCAVQGTSHFVRKLRSGPGVPKGYTITQHEHPIALAGRAERPERKPPDGVRITRVHLEEADAEVLPMDRAGAVAVDFNRAGLAIAVVRTEIDLASPADAAAFVRDIEQRLEFVGVLSTGREQGAVEVRSAIAPAEPGKAPTAFASDAPFVVEPDLPPLVLDPKRVAEIQRHLKEAPAARRARFHAELELSEADAIALTETAGLADYFELVARAAGDARAAAEWVGDDVRSALAARQLDIAAFPVRPTDLGELLTMIRDGIVSRAVARRIFAVMLDTGVTAPQVAAEHHLVGDGADAPG